MPLINPEACKELLRRSKQAPLHVGALDSYTPDPGPMEGDAIIGGRAKSALSQCLAMTLAESRRIESLDLSVLAKTLSWQTRPKYLERAFDQANFAVLKELRVNLIQGVDEEDELIVPAGLSDWIAPFLRRVVSEDSSTLHTLHLAGLPFTSYQDISSTNIVCLHIFCRESISTPAVIRLIGSFPRLESLRLHIIAPREVDHAQVVSLPHLRVVDLGGPSMTFILAMLESIISPRSPSSFSPIEFNLLIHDGPDVDLVPETDFGTTFRTTFETMLKVNQPSLALEGSSVEAEPYRSLGLRLGADRLAACDMQLVLCRTAGIQWDHSFDISKLIQRDGTDASTIDLSYFLPIDPPELMKTAAETIADLILSKGTQNVVLSLDQELGASTIPMLLPWIQILSFQIPTLKALQISMSAASQQLIFDCLAPSLDAPHKIPFPSLQTLVLQDGLFGPETCRCHLHPEPYSSSPKQFLYRALERRKDSGHFIPNLTLQRASGIDEQFIEELKVGKVVGSIEWDGIERWH